ncbi:secreted protein [Melampsora americana]|nr:secreted protein [Melampsora americana]
MLFFLLFGFFLTSINLVQMTMSKPLIEKNRNLKRQGGQTMSCTLYDDGHSQGAWCNRSHMCVGGCEGPYITAHNCLEINENTDALGTPVVAGVQAIHLESVVCTVAYDHYAQGTQACNTDTKTYSCKGEPLAGSHAVCHGCLDTSRLLGQMDMEH